MMREQFLYEKLLEIIILSNYEEKFPLEKNPTSEGVGAYKQRAFDYYFGRWDKLPKSNHIINIDFEQTKFHTRCQKTAHLVLNEINKHNQEKEGRELGPPIHGILRYCNLIHMGTNPGVHGEGREE